MISPSRVKAAAASGALVAAFIIAACTGSNRAVPPAVDKPAEFIAGSDVQSTQDACAADSDCIVSNFAGCCACPQCSVSQPTAYSVEHLERKMGECQAATCDASICNFAGLCPSGEAAARFVPRCSAGVCIGVRR